MSDDLAGRIERVRARIAAAAVRAGRTPEHVTLIAVTKDLPDQVAGDAINHGLTDLGENRVQEGVRKAAALTGSGIEPPRWHLIGNLQRNKVRDALALFGLIHSVDSERLLERINALAERPAEILIEVNVSGEASKHGVSEAGLPVLIEQARHLPNIALTGLMTVAPLLDDPGEARPIFRRLRALAEQHGLPNLSMGMTNDFEVAIEEGATHVRVGRALFGERPT